MPSLIYMPIHIHLCVCLCILICSISSNIRCILPCVSSLSMDLIHPYLNIKPKLIDDVLNYDLNYTRIKRADGLKRGDELRTSEGDEERYQQQQQLQQQLDYHIDSSTHKQTQATASSIRSMLLKCNYTTHNINNNLLNLKSPHNASIIPPVLKAVTKKWLNKDGLKKSQNRELSVKTSKQQKDNQQQQQQEGVIEWKELQELEEVRVRSESTSYVTRGIKGSTYNKDLAFTCQSHLITYVSFSRPPPPPLSTPNFIINV